MKKYLLLGLVLFACLATLSSCKLVVRPLEGTWTVTYSEVTSGTRVLGNGTVTLSYSGELMAIEIYTGSGSFVSGTYDYIAAGTYWPGFGSAIQLHEVGDTDSDYITLEDMAYAGGSTMSGSYSGTGAYASGGGKNVGAGTFTATK